jgi:phosphatidylinositol kinase/protein kinase (PI-3  family)
MVDRRDTSREYTSEIELTEFPLIEGLSHDELIRAEAAKLAVEAAPFLRTSSRQELLRDARAFATYIRSGEIPSP